MKKIILGAVLLAFATALAAPAVFAGDPEIKVHAELWSRYEFLSNWLTLEDDDDTDPLNDDSLDFGAYRARIGVAAKVNDMVSAYMEIQNQGAWGDTFVGGNAQDPLLGPINAMSIPGGGNDMVLYQGWVNLDHVGGSLLSLKIGRQEHTLGNELHMGDSDFYSGQYFDGIRANLDFESWELDLFHYWIEERNVLPGSLIGNGLPPFNGNSNDRTFFGASAAFSVADGHDLEPYILHSRDNNWDSGGILTPAHAITTYGVLYQRPEAYDSPFDWSLEVAAQSGDLPSFFCVTTSDRCDQSSMVAEGAFGYTFGEDEDSHHRVGVGMLMLGDGDDSSEVESFIPLFPDTHRRAGILDAYNTFSTVGYVVGNTFHNLTDVYLEWGWTNNTHGFGAAYHMYSCTEENNCFNFGGPDDDLGSEIDLMYDWTQSEFFGFHVGIAMWDPGDTFESSGFSPDGVMRAYGMARFRM